MDTMGFLKWCFLLSFFAVVLSDDLSSIPEINHSDLKLDQDKLMQFINSKPELLKILQRYPDASRKEQTAIVNEFADELIANLNELLVQIGVDPVDIPGFEQNFYVFFVKGWVKIENGELSGIASIERRGDVELYYEYPILGLHMTLGLSRLKFQYNYEAKLMGLGPAGIMEGKSDGSKFTVGLSINLTNLRASLDAWKLNSIGKVSVKFRGSITGQIINILSTVVVPLLKPIIKTALDLVIGGGLEFAVNAFNSVICQILGDCEQIF